MSLNECREKCLRNCSCVAFANTDIRGFGNGCAIWFGELVDIQVVRKGGQDLYVRMLASELETKKTSSSVVGVIIGAAAQVILGLVLIGFYVIRSKRRNLEGFLNEVGRLV
ncbi:G-type lectin S-receptor-like serine/threonine-protein kinase [Cucumis melo var. makuwa]|uniref:G-type lectin S-receptor-like serine/threonine-protein kinase n=1 Tax=Cucumis melo var. makuwa TaxID=1194695 RepID=A0A5A7TQJ7_CUCMM|nr:G-type lectin S-receptor-like serine/threonine-protein kinase [Cucumis melo var. makuwa]TYK02616.1 G-type lectin S-receptor-like serine/threonine-protein kinase [Cucumis melo var. makuwa]